MTEIELVRWYTGWDEQTARNAIGVWREFQPDWTAEGLRQYCVSSPARIANGEDVVQSTDANAASAQ